MIIVVGVGLVGVSALAVPKKPGEEAATSALGISLILIAQFFTGIQFIVEEKLLSGYYLDPIKVVGLEGMWGFLYYLIFLPIAQNIPCTDKNMCVPPCLEDSR